MTVVEAVRWSADGGAVDIIDQRALPVRLVRLELRTADEICEAIRTLAVRGAPAIGVAGAMGLVVALAPLRGATRDAFLAAVHTVGGRIARVRPTAVNLRWAVERVVARARETGGPASAIHEAMRAEATRVLEEDREMCQRIGEHGLALLSDGSRVLTHCNAGALATGGIGTALAPVYRAAALGWRISVFADETRPLMQGSRLTAWELAEAGIEVTVLADSMAASLLRDGRVDAVIVGADRIAANGDVANKIGTYPLALAARHHGVPFYVAAPWSTIDLATATGAEIEIEHRCPGELADGFSSRVAPAGVAIYNPAFDVTPAELVSAIVTDRGVLRGPYSLARQGHDQPERG